MIKAVNWNQTEDDLTLVFWNQNIRQFWVDEEISISEDINTWNSKLSKQQKDVYKRVSSILTLLDSAQGGIGMINIANNTNNLHHKALLQYIGFMEQMHAKSYSTIFSTFCSSEEINELFDYVHNDELIQRKIELIVSYYNELEKEKTNTSYIKALCASVLLESFLFYSGFFYPLYLAGQGIMVNTCEIFNLIIRDESIHGMFIGWLAQQQMKNISNAEKDEIEKFVANLVHELMNIEIKIAQNIYDQLNLTDEVINFMKYNANKALNNVGFEAIYDISDDDVNIVVINGLKTDTKNHDFFSVKGNGYIKNVKKVELTDDDFDW